MSYRQPFYGDWPITQRYGEIVPGVTVNNKPHTGIDYGCPTGTEILASNSGIVLYAGFDLTGYGNCVIILHSDGNGTVYAHLNKIMAYTRKKVEKGEVIGLSGSTGNSTGPHLHFEARHTWNDSKSHFDPMLLPLQSVDDTISNPVPVPAPVEDETLKGASAFHAGEILTITAPLGAKAFTESFSYYTPLPQDTQVCYTGRTTQRNGYTYMEVTPLSRPVWVAVHDGETQILDHQENK